MKTKALVCVYSLLGVSFAQEVFLQEVKVKAKKEILSEREVRESSAKDPGEALYRLVGVWKLRKGGIANDVVLRGFQRANINLLYDGTRIYGACPNRMDPPAFHVDFSEVKSVEVIKGAFDVRNYGSLGGVVNIRTKEPEKGLHSKLNLSLGSFYYFNPSFQLSYGAKAYGFLLGYSYRYSKPYRTGEGKRFTEYSNYKPSEYDATAFSINTAWTKLILKPSEDVTLKFDYTLQRARDVLYPYLLMDSPEDNADRLNFKLKVRNLHVSVFYSYIYHRMDNLKRNSPTYMQTIAKTKTSGARIEYDLGNSFLGLETFKWSWDAKTKMGSMPYQNTIPNVDFVNLGVFWEHGRKLTEKLKLLGGLRADYTLTEADKDKANTNLYYAYHNTRDTKEEDLYPSANAQLLYSPNKGLELFAGLGYSVRTPDAQERYFALDRMMSLPDWVGNPSLKPSKNMEIDVGAKWKNPQTQAQINLFYSFVRDFVIVYQQKEINDVVSGNVARSYTNVDARIYGTEAQVIHALKHYLFIEGGISYVIGEKDTDPSKNIKDKDLAEIPPVKIRVSVRYDRGDVFGEFEGIASATQDRTDSDLGETKTPGWAILNFKAGIEEKSLRLIMGVDNLLDKFYYEHLSYLRDPFSTGTKVPEPGRSFYLNLSYIF